MPSPSRTTAMTSNTSPLSVPENSVSRSGADRRRRTQSSGVHHKVVRSRRPDWHFALLFNGGSHGHALSIGGCLRRVSSGGWRRRVVLRTGCGQSQPIYRISESNSCWKSPPARTSVTAPRSWRSSLRQTNLREKLVRGRSADYRRSNSLESPSGDPRGSCCARHTKRSKYVITFPLPCGFLH